MTYNSTELPTLYIYSSIPSVTLPTCSVLESPTRRHSSLPIELTTMNMNNLLSVLYSSKVASKQPLSESTWSTEAFLPLLWPLQAPILLSAITTALKQTVTIDSDWIHTSWIWPQSDSGDFPLDGTLHYNYPGIFLQTNKGLIRAGVAEGWDGLMDGFREKKDAAGIEGRIWCVCVCVFGRGWEERREEITVQ